MTGMRDGSGSHASTAACLCDQLGLLGPDEEPCAGYGTRSDELCEQAYREHIAEVGEDRPAAIAPLYERTPSLGQTQAVYRFPNGYGASVVRGPYTYGGRDGLFELAVAKWHGEGDDDWGICYDTPLTDDVFGYLTDAEVMEKLREIEALT